LKSIIEITAGGSILGHQPSRDGNFRRAGRRNKKGGLEWGDCLELWYGNVHERVRGAGLEVGRSWGDAHRDLGGGGGVVVVLLRDGPGVDWRKSNGSKAFEKEKGTQGGKSERASPTVIQSNTAGHL